MVKFKEAKPLTFEEFNTLLDVIFVWFYKCMRIWENGYCTRTATCRLVNIDLSEPLKYHTASTNTTDLSFKNFTQEQICFFVFHLAFILTFQCNAFLSQNFKQYIERRSEISVYYKFTRYLVPIWWDNDEKYEERRRDKWIVNATHCKQLPKL